jgi:hypothetical protein
MKNNRRSNKGLSGGAAYHTVKDPFWWSRVANRKRKTAKAQAAKAKERERYAAEIAAFEQRERFTLVKQSLREHWPDDEKDPMPTMAKPRTPAGSGLLFHGWTVEELKKLKAERAKR